MPLTHSGLFDRSTDGDTVASLVSCLSDIAITSLPTLWQDRKPRQISSSFISRFRTGRLVGIGVSIRQSEKEAVRLHMSRDRRSGRGTEQHRDFLG
jgi:hypothetical protein